LAWVFFAFFIIVPLLEILAFIEVGSFIGALPTLGFTLLTAVIGAAIVRRQGLQIIGEARQRLADNQIPLTSALHGGFLLLAGILLLTPGFVTDMVGFLLLIPPLRLLIAKQAWKWLKGRAEVQVETVRARRESARQPTVIDGEAVEIDVRTPPEPPRDEPSPWASEGHGR
jgi:UPF0716 protein FxsA